MIKMSNGGLITTSYYYGYTLGTPPTTTYWHDHADGDCTTLNQSTIVKFWSTKLKRASFSGTWPVNTSQVMFCITNCICSLFKIAMNVYFGAKSTISYRQKSAFLTTVKVNTEYNLWSVLLTQLRNIWCWILTWLHRFDFLLINLI